MSTAEIRRAGASTGRAGPSTWEVRRPPCLAAAPVGGDAEPRPPAVSLASGLAKAGPSEGGEGAKEGPRILQQDRDRREIDRLAEGED